MTRIYLVRHGEACGNVERNFHGFYDSNLTENGKRQIKLMAEAISKNHIDNIYSSDLKRCVETAQAIADIKKLPVKTRSDLREINGGEWEDVPWDDLPLRFQESYNTWLYTPHLLQMPGGESMKGFAERVWRAFEEIASLHRGEQTVIATHGTAIKVLMCLAKGFPLEKLNDVAWCDNTAISIIDIDENMQKHIVSEGDNTHLGEYGTISKQKWWRDTYL